MANAKTFPLKLPPDAYEKLAKIAKDEHRPMSDLIRLALEEYCEKRGYTVDLSMQRGGYRERKEET